MKNTVVRGVGACAAARIVVSVVGLLGAWQSFGHDDAVRIETWDRGILVSSPKAPSLYAYLWFFEWTMFDALVEGEHTAGRSDWHWNIEQSAGRASAAADWFEIRARATEVGADLELRVTNTSERAWPELAAIIPCFSPGFDRPRETDARPNEQFFDDAHDRTWFMCENRLALLAGAAPREIHFNRALRSQVREWLARSGRRELVWAGKWPMSERYADEGLILRESSDRTQTIAVAWEDFVSAQGHNPWKCMHLSVRLGPLAAGESKTIRGKLYLLNGPKEKLLEIWRADFGRPGG